MEPAELYDNACATPSDINEHLPTFAMLSGGKHVTEFGVRSGVSTIAWIYGRPSKLVSYDLRECPNIQTLQNMADTVGVDFKFVQGSTLEVAIENTDILFIDTLHTRTQLEQELRKHSEQVREMIVLHDTSTFGDAGECGGTSEGMWPVVENFVGSGVWEIGKRYTNNNGLTILKRVK